MLRPEIVFVEIHFQLFQNNTGFDADNKDDFEKLKKLKIQI